MTAALRNRCPQRGIALPADSRRGIALPADSRRGIALPADSRRGIALPAHGQRGIAPHAHGQRGIALPAVVFALVLMGLMLSAGLLLAGQSQHGQTLQLQSARALAAAKSGTEWGLWQVADPTASQGLGAGVLPPCFATQTLALPSPLADLTVQVSCTRDPSSGSADEGGLKLASYRVLATASGGAAGHNDFVQRRFEARATVCKNPGGSAPRYAC